MVSEIPTLKLKLDSDSLPLSGGNLPFGFTIGIASLNCFHIVTKFSRYNPKQEDNATLVHWFMSEAPEIYRVAVCRTVAEACMRLSGHRRGRCVVDCVERDGVNSRLGRWATAVARDSWQEGQNIRPFGIVGCELAEVCGDARPRPEVFLKNAGAVCPLLSVLSAGGIWRRRLTRSPQASSKTGSSSLMLPVCGFRPEAATAAFQFGNHLSTWYSVMPE